MRQGITNRLSRCTIIESLVRCHCEDIEASQQIIQLLTVELAKWNGLSLNASPRGRNHFYPTKEPLPGCIAVSEDKQGCLHRVEQERRLYANKSTPKARPLICLRHSRPSMGARSGALPAFDLGTNRLVEYGGSFRYQRFGWGTD